MGVSSKLLLDVTGTQTSELDSSFSLNDRGIIYTHTNAYSQTFTLLVLNKRMTKQVNKSITLTCLTSSNSFCKFVK